MSVIDRTMDVQLEGVAQVHKIHSDEFGPGILIHNGGHTVSIWGPPSLLHSLIEKAERALWEIVDPTPASERYVPPTSHWVGD